MVSPSLPFSGPKDTEGENEVVFCFSPRPFDRSHFHPLGWEQVWSLSSSKVFKGPSMNVSHQCAPVAAFLQSWYKNNSNLLLTKRCSISMLQEGGRRKPHFFCELSRSIGQSVPSVDSTGVASYNDFLSAMQSQLCLPVQLLWTSQTSCLLVFCQVHFQLLGPLPRKPYLPQNQEAQSQILEIHV